MTKTIVLRTDKLATYKIKTKINGLCYPKNKEKKNEIKETFLFVIVTHKKDEMPGK